MKNENDACSDCELLAPIGSAQSYTTDQPIASAEDPPETALLLKSGTASVAVQTGFGDYSIGEVTAPVLLQIHRCLNETSCPSLIKATSDCEVVTLSADQVRDLLIATTVEAQAFRRLTLSGVTRVIRLANRSISRMFDVNTVELNEALLERMEDVTQSQQPVPVSSHKMRKILETAGLGFHDLPSVGLTARKIEAESFLLQAGSRGTEAFLLAEGRLRVSLPIPRVGEEALAILDPGQFVGEMSLIDDEPRSADVVAHEGPAQVYVLSRMVFRYLLNTGSSNGAPLLAGLSVVLSKRAEEALQRVVTFRHMAGAFI